MATPSPLPLPADAPATSPIQFGVPLDQSSSLLFFGCLIAAIGLVYLFCRQKFNERSVTGNDDYVYQLLPSQLATPQEYNKGFLTYFGTMVFTVLLLSLIGPKNLGALGITLPQEIGNVIVPLAVALLLVGVMPNVPIVQEIERRLRQYAHEMAYIPKSALATAERLSAAQFNFSSYTGEALRSEEMRGIAPADFQQSRRSLEYAWARLGCLVYEQKSCVMSGSNDWMDTSLLRAYKNDLELIQSSKRSMEADVAAYRLEKAENPTYTNEALHLAIRSSLYKLYVLLGCAVRLKKQPHNDINLALKRFGFELPETEAEPDNGDLKLVGLTVVAAAVLLLGFSAVGLGQLGLWHVSAVFPQTFAQPFMDTAWVLIPYVAAIMVADLMRKRAIKNGWWFGNASGMRRPISANYIRVALVCGIAGYVGLVLWGFTFSAPTIEGLKIDAPYMLLAMVTGGFYVWHLDNVELNRRPSRSWEVSCQTVLTLLCGLIAATASWNIILGAASVAIDRIVLTATISATVGFALAWYIPKAATRYDPLEAARMERVQSLAAAAGRRFGGPAAAAEWLERPHPALDNKSPKAVAADVEGFEHAIGLLQGPRALAA